MPPAPAFQEWLRSARALDWSPRRRQHSALEAFALLQQTCMRLYQHATPRPGKPPEAPVAAGSRADTEATR